MFDRNDIASRTAGSYALFAAVWILASDMVLWLFIDSVVLRRSLQTAKAWTFVVVTSLLLYSFISRELRELDRARTAERQREDELRAARAKRRELLAELVTAQEEERRRIAKDVHDDPVQVLTALGLRLSLVRSLVPAGPAADRLGELEGDVLAATARLRTFMADVAPPELDRDGLMPTIRRYLDRAFVGRVEVRLEGGLRSPLRRESAITAYRILIEALTNARTHADARSIVIRLEERDGGIAGSVVDDGIGLDRSTPGSPTGIGLETMRMRARSIGGWCRIEPGPGAGTRVRFWLPLDADAIDEPDTGARPETAETRSGLATPAPGR